MTLPATGSYTATETNQGTGLSLAWTQVSGPGTVVLDAPTSAATRALYPEPQLTAPSIPTGQAGTISDGSSNTILPCTILVNGTIANLILTVGQHTITIRFLGAPLFQASQAQATVLVQ